MEAQPSQPPAGSLGADHTAPGGGVEGSEKKDAAKKPRNAEACFVCHRRKVKCSVDFDKYPVEKCNNCYARGEDCRPNPEAKRNR